MRPLHTFSCVDSWRVRCLGDRGPWAETAALLGFTSLEAVFSFDTELLLLGAPCLAGETGSVSTTLSSRNLQDMSRATARAAAAANALRFDVQRWFLGTSLRADERFKELVEPRDCSDYPRRKLGEVHFSVAVAVNFGVNASKCGLIFIFCFK